MPAQATAPGHRMCEKTPLSVHDTQGIFTGHNVHGNSVHKSMSSWWWPGSFWTTRVSGSRPSLVKPKSPNGPRSA